jgi:cation:H+ antiporter
VGSNIFNVLFILGLSALIIPLMVSSQLVRRDVPIMIGVSLSLWLLAVDGAIGRLDGLLLFAGAVAYTVWSIVQGRREQQYLNSTGNERPNKVEAITSRYIGAQGIILLLGLILLVAGANRLVLGGVSLARFLGVSELVIGLTIIAVGTSLPEVAASVVASLRKERDIAVGNVVGSNIFNILVVLGLAAAISPRGVTVSPAAVGFDIPVMIAVALICLPIFFTGGMIARWEGVFFLSYYLSYSLYLFFSATQSSWFENYQLIMIVVVIPLTALTLLVSVIQSVRAGD